MFVCQVCHPKLCSFHHVIVTFAPCEFCRIEAECVDCVSSAPVTKAELEAQIDGKAWSIEMYRHAKLVKYPRKPKEPE